MKNYIDRVREMSLENLKRMINQQENNIEIEKRDLETMKLVLKETQEGRGWRYCTH